MSHFEPFESYQAVAVDLSSCDDRIVIRRGKSFSRINKFRYRHPSFFFSLLREDFHPPLIHVLLIFLENSSHPFVILDVLCCAPHGTDVVHHRAEG